MDLNSVSVAGVLKSIWNSGHMFASRPWDTQAWHRPCDRRSQPSESLHHLSYRHVSFPVIGVCCPSDLTPSPPPGAFWLRSPELPGVFTDSSDVCWEPPLWPGTPLSPGFRGVNKKAKIPALVELKVLEGAGLIIQITK